MSRSKPEGIDRPNSLVRQLKAKNKDRRAGLARLAAAEVSLRQSRNDLLPDSLKVDISLDDLRVPARNVRKIDPAHVREVAASIKALGFCVPLLVGKNNTVIDGVIRIEAARLLGLERVPCIHIGHLVRRRAAGFAACRQSSWPRKPNMTSTR